MLSSPPHLLPWRLLGALYPASFIPSASWLTALSFGNACLCLRRPNALHPIAMRPSAHGLRHRRSEGEQEQPGLRTPSFTTRGVSNDLEASEASPGAQAEHNEGAWPDQGCHLEGTVLRQGWTSGGGCTAAQRLHISAGSPTSPSSELLLSASCRP